jgi:hypothetical protein
MMKVSNLRLAAFALLLISLIALAIGANYLVIGVASGLAAILFAISFFIRTGYFSNNDEEDK